MKRFFSLLMVLVLVFAFTACSKPAPANTADPENGGEAKDSYTFAVVYSVVHPFFQGTTDGAEAKAAEYGNVELIVKAPDTADASKQIQIMEDLIAMKVDGIAIGPTDSAALKPLIDKATEQGIQIVTFDTDSPDSTRLGYIGTDNVSAGRHMGEVLGEQLGGKGKVLVSMGVATQQNLIERLEGVKAVLSEKYPDIEIVDEQSSQGDTSIALANIENMVTAHPDFDALIGIDAAAGPAAVVAWKAQGLDKVVITFDDTDDIIQGVRDGQITVTLAQNQYLWGTTIIDELMAACKGESIPAFFDAGTREVDANNVAELYPELSRANITQNGKGRCGVACISPFPILR